MKIQLIVQTILITVICRQESVAAKTFLSIRQSYKYVTQTTADTNKAKALFVSGLKYLVEKKYKEAIAKFDSTILINPEYAEAYNERANAKLDGQVFEKGKPWAWEDYDKAISIKPQFAKAYYDRGMGKNSLESNRKPISGCVDICKAFELGYPNEKQFRPTNCDCIVKTDHSTKLPLELDVFVSKKTAIT